MLSGIARIVAAVCVGIVVAAATTSPASTRSGAFVIHNVRIFDGEKIIDADSVAVANGKIVAVGKNVAAPPDAQVIDGTGDTLLPGLIDSHVHAWIRDVLKADLVMGITTDLDMYMWSQKIAPWREQEVRGAPDVADFRTAGTAIVVAGGHGTEKTLPPITPIRGPEEAQAFVDERVAQGSDYIKIFYDDAPWFAAMPKGVMVAIVRDAHKRGKLAVVHIYSAQGFLDAIDAGADGLAHVPIVKMPEPQFTDALEAHHVFAITTLGYTDFFFGRERLWSKLPDDPLIAPYLGPIARRMLSQPGYPDREHISYVDNAINLRTLRDAGVPVLAGTDANDAQSGALLHAELELMVKAGLTTLETLADATSVPAKIFSLNDRGRIAPGLRADLLLVRGDPTKDIRKTRNIVAIWKQGVRVDRESYRHRTAQENEAWKFGAGWMPDADTIFKGTSKVRLRVVDGGPDRSPSTMILACDVRPEIKYPFAGAMFIPALAQAEPKLAGIKEVSFWSRGDGKTYSVAMFTKAGGATPVLRPFVAGKDWEKHTIPISEFHTDGHDISLLSIVATEPGTHNFELSGFHLFPQP
jgi:imidazolonepropionase-like amidohydrolase